MKLFKTIDEKFEEIGFIKTREDKYGATYIRRVESHNYTQRLDLLHKSSGKHLLQSYDPDLIDGKNIGCTNVGLSMYETKLCLEKMKQMGWKIVR